MLTIPRTVAVATGSSTVAMVLTFGWLGVVMWYRWRRDMRGCMRSGALGATSRRRLTNPVDRRSETRKDRPVNV